MNDELHGAEKKDPVFGWADLGGMMVSLFGLAVVSIVLAWVLSLVTGEPYVSRFFDWLVFW